MAKYKHSVRVDQFVDDHIDYLQGKMLLINSSLNAKIAFINESSLSEKNIKCKVCNKEITATGTDFCFTCENLITKNISLQEVENWRGLGSPREKKEKSC